MATIIERVMGKMERHNNKIKLIPAKKTDLPAFQKELQEAFSVAVIESFGDVDSGPIPPDEVIAESFNGPQAEVYHILLDDQKVGGVILNINKENHHNSMDLIYISPQYHSKGIGLATWNAIEEKYPETEVWELVTPYFEKRNINFYVNKCGFHIVEFYNEHHPEPEGHRHGGEGEEGPMDEEAFFRFEKVMKQPLKCSCKGGHNVN